MFQELDTRISDFAHAVAKEFLDSKTQQELASIDQDSVDAKVIPIITEVEDQVDKIIWSEVGHAVKACIVQKTDEWWR